MNVKSTTKAFVDRPDSNGINKGSGIQRLSPADMQRLGADNIGDALNKIADPQWMDPSKKMRTVGNNALDKDAFMKLMLTQMKHQDPTNPMQAHEMAAQLASFTSVEQLQNLNSTMDSLKKAQAPIQQFETLNLLGKAVAGDSAQLTRTREDRDHNVQFKLLKDASQVSLNIKNSQGELVRQLSYRNLKEGSNSVEWNGQNEAGVDLGAGEYRIEVLAADANGAKVGVETNFEGVITGVNFTADGPLLMVGNRTVRFNDVKRIIDPSLMKDGQNVKNSSPQDLKRGGESTENIKKDSGIVPAVQGNLGQISMSREMLNQVEKQVGSEVSL